MGLYTDYLSPAHLAGFDQYKYSCQDTSPLSNYLMHPFWNRVVLFFPKWLAPNLMTFIGFVCCFLHYLIPTVLDYDFTASAKGSDHPISSFAWVMIGVLLFVSHTLDGIDGKQARRTGTSSPLGELFDHGCDSWSTVLIATTLYSIFGRNDDSFSIPIRTMYLIQWSVFLCFHAAHWEKYNTGVMYLPWGYDISMLGGTILYLLTAIVGYQFWKVNLPLGLTPGTVLALVLFAGTFLLSMPMTVYNIIMSYKNKTGKLRSFSEAMRPMVSLFFGFCICSLWVAFSRNKILESDVRCFFFMCGTLYANMSCRLIVAQMTSTRCELVNFLIYPLFLVVAVAILVPGLSIKTELTLLYGLTGILTVAHLHYAVCVVMQMCHHLRINCFSIKNYGEERLLEPEPDKSESSTIET